MRGREEMGEFPLGSHEFVYYIRSPPIYRCCEYIIFTKTFIIMSISIDIRWCYVCDPLGPYISLINNSTNPIPLIGLLY